MKCRSIIMLVEGVVLFGFLQILPVLAAASEHCGSPVGTLVSIQGDGQVRHHGSSAWQPVQMNDRFCAGDVLRIGPGGRAAVTLANETILRINQNSTLNFAEPQERISVLQLIKGVLHIFSHRPRSLKVSTPYVNGNVEGTEFLSETTEIK